MISIIVPAHNEEGNLEKLVNSLLDMIQKEGLDSQIILVDDNSTDRTPGICDELSKSHKEVICIHRKGAPGMGAALKEGTKNAKGNVVAWMMADLADDPYVIPKFEEEIKKGADLVIGSRYIAGGRPDLPFVKRTLSHGYTVLSRILFGIKIHDITNAFRGFRKDVFEELKVENNDFSISPEFSLMASICGYQLSEVPASYKNRVEGHAKFKIVKMGKAYIRVMLYAFGLRLLGKDKHLAAKK